MLDNVFLWAWIVFAVDASFDCKGYSWLFLPDDFLK